MLGFQFSRRQIVRGTTLLLAGFVALGIACAVWYLQPRAVSRWIQSVDGRVAYHSEQVPKFFPAAEIHSFLRDICGFTQTDDQVDQVYITDANVTDEALRRLKPLTNLEDLRLHERQLGPGLRHLAGLSKLSSISVSDLCAGDLSHLRQLPHLHRVELIRMRCGDADLSPLAEIPNLAVLSLRGPVVTPKHIEQISRVKGLTMLMMSVDRNDALTADDLSRLSECPLAYCEFQHATDEIVAGLAKCESLVWLRLPDATLTDSGIAALAKHPNLEELSLIDCRQPLDIESLQQKMPSCLITYRLRTH